MRRLGSLIGAGGTGSVYEAVLLESDGSERRAAAKELHSLWALLAQEGIRRLRNPLETSTSYRSVLEREHACLQRLPQGAAVRSLGVGVALPATAGETEDVGGGSGGPSATQVLFMEECACDLYTATGMSVREGDISRALRSAPRGFRAFLESDTFCAVSRALLQLLDTLQRHGVFPRDLKLENVLVRPSGAPGPFLALTDGDELAFFDTRAPVAAECPPAQGTASARRDGGVYSAQLERAVERDPHAVEAYGVVEVGRVLHRTREMQTYVEGDAWVDPVLCGSATAAMCLWAACRGGGTLSERGFADPAAPERAWFREQWRRVARAVAESSRGERTAEEATPAQVRAYLVAQDLHFQRTGRDEDLVYPADGRPAFDFFAESHGLVHCHPLVERHPANPLHRPFVRRALLLLLLPSTAAMSPAVALATLALFRPRPGAGDDGDGGCDDEGENNKVRDQLIARASWRFCVLPRCDEAQHLLANMRGKQRTQRDELLTALLAASSTTHRTRFEQLAPFFSLLRAHVGEGAWPHDREPWNLVPRPETVFGSTAPEAWLATHFRS